MFSRLRDLASRVKTKTVQLKEKLQTIYQNRPSARKVYIVAYNSVLGIAIVTARVGSAIWTVDKFFANTSGDPQLARSTEAMLTGALLGVGVGIIIFDTRFWSLYRNEKKRHELEAQQAAEQKLTDEETLTQAGACEEMISNPQFIEALLDAQEHGFEDEPDSNPIPLKPTFWHPGIEATKCSQALYVADQGSNYYYLFGSGLSSILSVVALAQLFNPAYDDHCGIDRTNAQIAAIAAVFGGTVIQYAANSKSFMTYNLPALRDYFRDLVINGGIKKISKWNKFEVGLSALLNSLGIYYTNIHLFDDIQNRMICHATPFVFDMTFVKTASWMFAINNFLVQSIMTYGAIYNRQVNAEKLRVIASQSQLQNLAPLSENPAELKEIIVERIEEQTNIQPQTPAASAAPQNAVVLFNNGLADLPVKYGIVANAIALGFMGTYNSIVTLPKTTANRDLSHNIGMILLAIALGIIAIRNQAALDIEGHARKVKADLEEKMQELANQTANATSPKEPSTPVTPEKTASPTASPKGSSYSTSMLTFLAENKKPEYQVQYIPLSSLVPEPDAAYVQLAGDENESKESNVVKASPVLKASKESTPINIHLRKDSATGKPRFYRTQRSVSTFSTASMDSNHENEPLDFTFTPNGTSFTEEFHALLGDQPRRLR